MHSKGNVMSEVAVYNTLKGQVKQFQDLLGRSVSRVAQSEDEMTFFLTETNYVRFYHSQDCCEQVYIEDVCGDLNDLVESEILEAEEVTQEADGNYESATWTFYKFRTAKGSVTVRWLGTSNGYYSEAVSIEIV